MRYVFINTFVILTGAMVLFIGYSAFLENFGQDKAIIYTMASVMVSFFLAAIFGPHSIDKVVTDRTKEIITKDNPITKSERDFYQKQIDNSYQLRRLSEKLKEPVEVKIRLYYPKEDENILPKTEIITDEDYDLTFSADVFRELLWSKERMKKSESKFDTL